MAVWPRLRRAAYLLTGDHHLAEDLAQDALARTYVAWRRVRRDDAQAYARKVLVNLNIDRLRKRRPTEVVLEAAGQLSAPDGSRGSDDRDEAVRLLAELSERERRIVVMRHYLDLSEAQVAAELGLPAGTVKSALSRALAKMRCSAAAIEVAGGPS